MERNYNIDLLKALSLFGVVYVHSASLVKTEYAIPGYYFRFCVPVFIICSFFLSEKGMLLSEEKKLPFIKKRIIRLFIPYIVWSIMYFLMYYKGGYGIAPIISKHFAGYGWMGQYFFIIMFQLVVIFPFIRKYCNYKIVIILFFATIILYIACFRIADNILITYIIQRLFISWLFYIMLGILTARYVIKPVSGWQKNVLLIATVVFIPLVIIAEAVELQNLRINAEAYLRPFVLIVSCILFYLLLKVNITNELIKKTISNISYYSMGIFCLNTLVINSLGDLLYSLKINLEVPSAVPKFLAFIFPLISVSIVLLICIIISIALKKIGLKRLVQ